MIVFVRQQALRTWINTSIANFLRETGSSLYNTINIRDLYDIAKDMHLVSDLEEYRKPKNAAVLCFGRNPQKYFEYARIEVVVYSDDAGDTVEEHVFRGTLFDQYRNALQFQLPRFTNADKKRGCGLWQGLLQALS